MTAREFDVVCIGAGVCGEAVATELAGSGLSLALVEEHLVGGECSYWGCVPTKTMLRSAEVLKELERARELAVSNLQYELDFPRAHRRTAWMAREWDDARPARALEEQGATLVRGRAALTGPRLIEVDGQALTARRAVVVCPGTVPVVPKIPGLDEVEHWTNREAVRAEAPPASLLVMGGGAVGVELAQAFARFGAQVTLVEGLDRVLPAEEPEAGELLRTHLEADGIRVLTGVRVSRVESDDGGSGVRAFLEGAESTVAERLLVATGRRPNLDGSDLAAAGLVTGERGWLNVDPATLRAAEGIWAGGDVTGLGGFTHLAHYHGTLIGRSLRGEIRRASHVAVPRVTFTDPEVASVGMSEAQARKEGTQIRVVSGDPGEAARGFIHGFHGGLVKLIVDESRGVLAGATVVSPRAGEIIAELTLAVRANVPVSFLADTIHPYPSFSRVLQALLDEAATPS